MNIVLEILSIVSVGVMLWPLAFFVCTCCNCMLAQSEFDYTVISGSWTVINDFGPRWSTSSTTGAMILLTPPRSTESSGVALTWRTRFFDNTLTSATINYYGGYVDADNYLMAETVWLNTGGSNYSIVCKLFQRIAGVTTQLGSSFTHTHTDATTYVTVSLCWDGEFAHLSFENKTIQEPCSYLPTIWQTGLEVASKSGGGNCFNNLFKQAKRNETSTKLWGWGGLPQRCDCVTRCACTGNVPSTVVLELSGVTGGTTDRNGTYILTAADGSCETYSFSRTIDGFTQTITYTRTNGQAVILLNAGKAEHTLRIVEFSFPESTNVTQAVYSPEKRLNCDDYEVTFNALTGTTFGSGVANYFGATAVITNP